MLKIVYTALKKKNDFTSLSHTYCHAISQDLPLHYDPVNITPLLTLRQRCIFPFYEQMFEFQFSAAHTLIIPVSLILNRDDCPMNEKVGYGNDGKAQHILI